MEFIINFEKVERYLHTSKRMSDIVNVDQPNLFREFFPYSSLPKIVFDDKMVPMNLPEDIYITDTTFRDGQQAREPYTTEQMVNLYDLMHELSRENGVIRATELLKTGGRRMMVRLIVIMLLASVLSARAIEDKGFVLNILHDDEPVREIKEDGKRRVAIPFDAEYKLRLKNTNGRRCTARVKIDGAPVSKLGDIVVDSKGHIDLERFLDASLTKGKKFKFVSLDNPNVDDPDRKENGLVEVEFRLEKKVEPQIWQQPYIIITPDEEGQWIFIPNDYGLGGWPSVSIDCSSTILAGTVNTSVTMPGATVEGGLSDQSFTKVEMDMEEKTVVLKLWLRGIDNAG